MELVDLALKYRYTTVFNRKTDENVTVETGDSLVDLLCYIQERSWYEINSEAILDKMCVMQLKEACTRLSNEEVLVSYFVNLYKRKKVSLEDLKHIVHHQDNLAYAFLKVIIGKDNYSDVFRFLYDMNLDITPMVGQLVELIDDEFISTSLCGIYRTESVSILNYLLDVSMEKFMHYAMILIGNTGTNYYKFIVTSAIHAYRVKFLTEARRVLIVLTKEFGVNLKDIGLDIRYVGYDKNMYREGLEVLFPVEV